MNSLRMPASGRAASLGFVLIVVMFDVLGIGLVMPVLPSLVHQFTDSPQAASLWYGVLAVSYGLMQFDRTSERQWHEGYRTTAWAKRLDSFA